MAALAISSLSPSITDNFAVSLHAEIVQLLQMLPTIA